MSSWLAHLGEQPAVRHHFVLQPEFFRGLRHTGHRQGSVEMESKLASWLGLFRFLLCLFLHADDVSKCLSLQATFGEPFLEKFKVRLREERVVVPVLAVLLLELRHERRPNQDATSALVLREPSHSIDTNFRLVLDLGCVPRFDYFGEFTFVDEPFCRINTKGLFCRLAQDVSSATNRPRSMISWTRNAIISSSLRFTSRKSAAHQ